MIMAGKFEYLADISDQLNLKWPENQYINIVCHGHSVPAGYFATPFVNSVHAYPHLLYLKLKERFPYAVLNVIVTAIGGENSVQGSARFDEDVLSLKPSVLTIDYGLNDRMVTLEESEHAWRSMIESALDRHIKLILLTPSWDQSYFRQDDEWKSLLHHTEQIRTLAEEYDVALADTFAAYEHYIDKGGDLNDLLSHINHPSAIGHGMIEREISSWFPSR